MLQARVDRTLCVGCGLCIELCPAVFARSEDRTAFVQVRGVSAEETLCCQEAAAACPVDAIALSDIEDQAGSDNSRF